MINFRKKSWKVRRALQKQNRGVKPRKQSTQFQGAKIFAHLISRCENFAHPKTKVRNPWAKRSHFRTPLPQGAKSISRCEIPFQGANFLKSNFAHHCGRCENFRTVRNPLLAHVCQFRTPQANFRTVRNTLLAHEWHFAHPKPIFAQCETRCKNFAQCEIECETPFKVRNSQFKVQKFRTMKF